jgi:hypothetical protein
MSVRSRTNRIVTHMKTTMRTDTTIATVCHAPGVPRLLACDARW